MATIVTVLASVRAAVHRPAVGTAGLDDAGLVAWANEELPVLRARIADDAPSYFEKVTADITVADGVSLVDLTAAPVSLTDFSKVRHVEVKRDSVYLPLRWAPSIASTVTAGMGGTYRVKYLPKPAVISGPADATDLLLPYGLDTCLIEQVCARVRRRFNENEDSHQRAGDAAYKDALGVLLRLSGLPQRSVDLGNMPAWPRWRFRGPATVEFVGGW